MKKMISLVLTLSILLSVFTACSAKETPDSSKPVQSSTSQAISEAKPEQRELNLFISYARFRTQIEDINVKFAEKMLKEQNIEVKINLEIPDEAQGTNILKVRMISEDVPDIYTLHALNDLPMFLQAGHVEDLSDQPWVSTLLEAPKTSVTIADKVYALPLESLYWGYMYNKDIFEKYKITPPRTLSEMKVVCETLKTNGEIPFLRAFKDEASYRSLLVLLTGGAIQSQNPDFIQQMNQNKTSFGSFKGLFDMLDVINANGNERALELGNSDAAGEFANGKAAMWPQGSWYAESILAANPNFNLGCAALPVSDDPKGTQINMSTSTSLAIHPKAKNKNIAKEYMAFWMEGDYSNEIFRNMKFNPVTKNHTFTAYPWVADALKCVDEWGGYLDPKIPMAVKTEFGKMGSEYFNKKITQADIVKALDAAWAEANKALAQG